MLPFSLHWITLESAVPHDWLLSIHHRIEDQGHILALGPKQFHHYHTIFSPPFSFGIKLSVTPVSIPDLHRSPPNVFVVPLHQRIEDGDDAAFLTNRSHLDKRERRGSLTNWNQTKVTATVLFVFIEQWCWRCDTKAVIVFIILVWKYKTKFKQSL